MASFEIKCVNSYSIIQLWHKRNKKSTIKLMELAELEEYLLKRNMKKLQSADWSWG